jgi:hypothetical protein
LKEDAPHYFARFPVTNFEIDARKKIPDPKIRLLQQNLTMMATDEAYQQCTLYSVVTNLRHMK